jgi:hypothetical protein
MRKDSRPERLVDPVDLYGFKPPHGRCLELGGEIMPPGEKADVRSKLAASILARRPTSS